MSAVDLMHSICAQAGWDGRPSQESGAAASCAVALERLKLHFAVFVPQELYVYADLRALPEDEKEEQSMLRKAGACCAQCWLHHPFTLCARNGFLRAELVLPADLAPEPALERLAYFLDDADYVLDNLSHTSRMQGALSDFNLGLYGVLL